MASEVELVRAELGTGAYAKGLSVNRIVDAMNNPVQVSVATTYRAVSVEEVANAAPQGLVKIQKAAGDYEAASNAGELATALPGAALAARLTVVGSVEVAAGTPGRALLDGAVPDFITATERDAIVLVGTVLRPVLQNCWQRWGWSHSVTIALVEEALSG